MFDFSLLFKIAGAGIILVIIDKVLKSSGKDDIATIANIAGVVIILMMVINLIVQLFDSVKTMFML
ncbi:stage III sporulation protein AC [Clostridium fallax]|uniref:Stage III sporulation protein AC n=1 Tax=Clostridium fallax TaxID=1533 RepID=A0A1M4XNP9_9CLOT|nr:stage III sporulation protein AC [Clostridium fallax]SHE94842.1 stage III sporulation protein AC [Clostridium fallax]SQB06339.1 stage III sporulation protein AC [Clostridium fallax]